MVTPSDENFCSVGRKNVTGLRTLLLVLSLCFSLPFKPQNCEITCGRVFLLQDLLLVFLKGLTNIFYVFFLSSGHTFLSLTLTLDGWLVKELLSSLL